MDTDIVTIDVGGTLFKTSVKTLLKIPYFAYMVTDCENIDNKLNGLFVDRSAKVFERVLAYVRDPKHPYPVKYAYELDFYDIVYDKDKLYDPLATLTTMKQQVNDISIYTRDEFQHVKLSKCYECYRDRWSNDTILCNRCRNNNICLVSDCTNKTHHNYCDNHKDDQNLCNTRSCGYQRYNNLSVCYRCHLNHLT